MDENEIIKKGIHTYNNGKTYIKPEDPVLQNRLEWFQDQKLALMIHWGLYCELGIVASWALSDEDATWSRHQIDWTNAATFKKQYFSLIKSFNPVRFQPERLADFAKESGFRYLILTTKHHDGFCLWDTKYTNFKVTDISCPFHTNVNADIVRHTFDCFRDRGLGIAAYFSKADWHSSYYWNPKLGAGHPTKRDPSYNPLEHPKLWNLFQRFTRNQILELCKNYGRIDILWLDAGWVCKANGQDILIGNIIKEARKYQPWLLVVDRTVGGSFENYVTPEQCVPDIPLGIPWESCVSIGNDFAYDYNDTYKSTRQLVSLLVNVVAKGGNLALNISPQPDGRLPKGAVSSSQGLGKWLKTYGEAIYGSRICKPYKYGNLYFTKKNNIIYVIRLYPDEHEKCSSEIYIPLNRRINSITLLGKQIKLKFNYFHNGLKVNIPNYCIEKANPIAHVFALKLE